MKKQRPFPAPCGASFALGAATLLTFAALSFPASAQEATDELETTVVQSEPVAPAPAPRPAPAPAPRPAPAPAPVIDEPPLILDDEAPLLATEMTAFRTDTPLIDIPQSVSIFTEERIDDQGFTSLGEIVDYTPGLNNTQGEGHRDAIVFRGVRSTADFYLDGVRDDVQYIRPLYNIEQVEIMRGPSALYFGRGGTGGIINRVMKKPVIGEEFAEGEFGIDTFGATITQFDWNHSFGGGGFESGKGGKGLVAEPTGAIRLNTFYETLENHRDFYDGERFGINPTVAFQLNSDTRLDLSYEFNNHERFIDRGIPTGADGLPATALNGIVYGDPDQNISQFESHDIRATLSHDFSDSWKGRVTAFYGRYDKFYQNFYASGYNQANNRVTLDGYADNTARESLVFSGDLIGEFDTGSIEHKLLIGAEFINTSSDQYRFDSFWDTTRDDNEVFNASTLQLRGGAGINAAGRLATNNFTTALADDTRVDVETYSVFLNDEIALSDHLDFILGARFDQFDIEVFDVVTGQTLGRTDEEISPRAGLVVKPTETVSLYGSYSESFLPRSGEQFSDLGGGANALDPDTYTNLEAGVKVEIQPNLFLNLALFEIEESSPEVDATNPGALVIVDSQTSGFEAELSGYVTDRWSVFTGYTYLDGEQVNQNGPTGLRLRELPEHMFSFWNRYQLTDRFGVGLGVVFQDDSFIDNGNTAQLPDYTRVDAAAYYQLTDKTSIQLNIENLFDTEYYPTSHANHQVTVGRPISAAVSVRSVF